ncbi:MAG: Ig-like domain-containing protein [Oscillospiraceae bacterium]|nr:Ig-like domain-containing protein [Oscillospiraceae bacterium]
MSNKRCARCGKVYPASYRSCPYCSGRGGGRRPPDNPVDQIIAFLQQHGERIFLTVTAVFLLIAALGIILTRCSGKDAEPPEDKTPPAQSDNTQEPEPPAEPMTLSKSALSLLVGETDQLTVSGGSGEPVWASSDEAVASVADGLITAKAAGTVTITVSCGLEKATCALTVTAKAPEVDVYLNRTDFSIRPGDPASFQMKVKVRETKKDYEGDVVWASADPGIASVSETGLVERVSRGTTTVTATIGEKVLECIVRVK